MLLRCRLAFRFVTFRLNNGFYSKAFFAEYLIMQPAL